MVSKAAARSSRVSAVTLPLSMLKRLVIQADVYAYEIVVACVCFGNLYYLIHKLKC